MRQEFIFTIALHSSVSSSTHSCPHFIELQVVRQQGRPAQKCFSRPQSREFSAQKKCASSWRLSLQQKALSVYTICKPHNNTSSQMEDAVLVLQMQKLRLAVALAKAMCIPNIQVCCPALYVPTKEGGLGNQGLDTECS